MNIRNYIAIFTNQACFPQPENSSGKTTGIPSLGSGSTSIGYYVISLSFRVIVHALVDPVWLILTPLSLHPYFSPPLVSQSTIIIPYSGEKLQQFYFSYCSDLISPGVASHRWQRNQSLSIDSAIQVGFCLYEVWMGELSVLLDLRCGVCVVLTWLSPDLWDNGLYILSTNWSFGALLWENENWGVSRHLSCKEFYTGFSLSDIVDVVDCHTG